jgi:hypothetical protein
MEKNRVMGDEFYTRKESSKGVLFMFLKTQTILKIIVCSEPSNFSLVCMIAQSLNACKKVGVRSHIPYLLRTWG